ncbi:MAG: type III secretion system chaperone [Methylocystis sp.]|uniref:type III secretion system chaperone n=1 Tax=Methylocystis sp. TaxID=1911079 RepID=UPI003DA20C40
MSGNIDSRQHAESLITSLGQQVGIPKLAFEKDKSVVLSFNEQMVTVSYDEKVDALTLFGLADRLPGQLGAEGLARLMALNAEMFQREQACILYNQTTLLVALLFRVDAWSMKSDGILPWIDRCIETIEASRERVWELLGADREKMDSDDTGGNFLQA